MHLAFLTPEYPHQNLGVSGGIGTSIKNLATALSNKHIRVTIFVYNQYENQVFKDEGIYIHAIGKRTYKIGGWFFYRKFIQRYLNKQITLKAIDAIEAPDWTGITAFMSLKCPLVVRFHGSDTYYCKIEGRKQKRKNFIFEKIAIKNANYLLSVSRYTARVTQEVFCLKKHVEVLPNGVDINKFNAADNDKINPQKILYFGTLIRKKGVLEIPGIFNRVIENLPGAQLYLAGSDVKDINERISTKSLICSRFSNKAKDNVRFLGKLSYQAMIQELQSATVVILPSFAEAFPMTWIEAMAMAKPLVTSNIGWASEVMVDGETGFTVDPVNHHKFALKIHEFLSNEDLRIRMGNAARNRIKLNFSSEVIAERNKEYYSKILGK